MTHVEVRCRCGGEIEFQPIKSVPPPPGAILATMSTPQPEDWRGWVWVCRACGKENGVTYDYGKLDLGIVRDAVLEDPPMDVWIFDE